MYKTEHAFTCLLLKESVANDVTSVSLFAASVCCEPRHRWVEVLAHVDAEGGHTEHNFDWYSQNNNVEMAAL